MTANKSHGAGRLGGRSSGRGRGGGGGRGKPCQGRGDGKQQEMDVELFIACGYNHKKYQEEMDKRRASTEKEAPQANEQHKPDEKAPPPQKTNPNNPYKGGNPAGVELQREERGESTSRRETHRRTSR
jgi:hypothetical protein